MRIQSHIGFHEVYIWSFSSKSSEFLSDLTNYTRFWDFALKPKTKCNQIARNFKRLYSTICANTKSFESMLSNCLEANNCQLLNKQHYGKVTFFPSWILPMLSQFYVQGRYLSCPSTILENVFHPQEANDTKKVHGYS